MLNPSACVFPHGHDLWLEWGIFFFYSRDPSFMSLIDSPFFVKFSKMANFNFRESWFGFFRFSEIRDQNPLPPFFVYLETQKKYISMKNSQIL